MWTEDLGEYKELSLICLGVLINGVLLKDGGLINGVLPMRAGPGSFLVTTLSALTKMAQSVHLVNSG